MTIVGKSASKPAAKRGKRVTSHATVANSRRKSATVVIDGIKVELRPVKGKRTLKRADIVRAVKKVISARVKSGAIGGANGSDE